MGTLCIKTSIAEGPSPVIEFAVTKSEQPWDVLISAPDLERLDVLLMTPAMSKRARRFDHHQTKGNARGMTREDTNEETNNIINDPADSGSDTTTTNVVVDVDDKELAVDIKETTIEHEYEQMPDPAISAVEDAARDDALQLIPAEMSKDSEQARDKQCGLLGQRKMRVRLGLPANFFIYERDSDLKHWDAMYPAVTREN
ncbi:hypothetical protein GGI05_001092, partial [Coemansia sp. RSA 2603]